MGGSPPTSQAPPTTRKPDDPLSFVFFQTSVAKPTPYPLPRFGLAGRSISMVLNFLRPGVPGMQPVGDLRTAKSAILFGAINGLFSPPVLGLCLCTGGGRPCDDDAEQQRYYQLANFVLAMLGVALLFVDMALSRTVIFASPLWPPMVRWMVWLTKALTCGTLQFGVNLVYFCLRMLCARFMLVFFA